MRKIFLCVLGALIISGCTSPKYNYTPKTESFSEPSIGTVNTAYVGDSLVSQGVKITLDGIRVTSPANVSMAYTITPGDFKKIGEDAGKEFYQPFGTQAGGVDKAALADMWQAIMVKNDGKQTLCVITIFSAAVCESGMPFKKVEMSTASDAAFQQTLLYNGRVGNKINIGYREASSNMARPAFNNDVEYDLSESKVIGYKGARIEIIEATNQSIKYKVLSNFR
ncbi:hypothetical protein AAIG39_25180 [Phytobacter palmae]|uniref:Lipoprotein n=1 Tax=Phytobacter palmae TaxID=1855371 RepID=A0ABU9VC73_9ENTR